MSLSLPSPEDEAPASHLTFRTLQRLEEQRESSNVPVPESSNIPVRQRSKRRERLDAEERRVWRSQKAQTFEALRDLRAESLGSFLQSPNLASAQLYALPRADEVPPLPIWAPDGRKPGKHKRGANNRPHPMDMSHEAKVWRSLMAERTEALRRRREAHQAARIRPYNTWRNLGAAGERGGLRAGQRAYPAQWASYLERFDNEGTDGWGSPLGVAFKRIERDYAGTKLLRALWYATDPERVYHVDEIAARLGIRRRMVEYWLDAACRRLWAEMTQVIHGSRDPDTRQERDAAERAEAAAWEMETRDDTKRSETR